MVEELELESLVEECECVWLRLEEPLGGNGASGGNVRLEDSCDRGRFRLSRALSRSSIRAISSKALILLLSSFSS